MYKVRPSDQEYAAELITKLDALVDAQRKSPLFYSIGLGSDLRYMFIHWWKRVIKQLKKIKSSHN